jgi:hypothetical protein
LFLSVTISLPFVGMGHIETATIYKNQQTKWLKDGASQTAKGARLWPAGRRRRKVKCGGRDRGTRYKRKVQKCPDREDKGGETTTILSRNAQR